MPNCCRLRAGNNLASRICAVLCFLSFARILKKTKHFPFSKIVAVADILPPPGRQQFGIPNLRCLVFFEFRKNFEKDEKFSVFKNRSGSRHFAASGPATIWG